MSEVLMSEALISEVLISEAQAGSLAAADPPSWLVFPASVRAVTRLSPTFLRITLTGEDLDAFADNGFDQRFKLILPVAGQPLPQLSGEDWYQQWRALPDESRPVLRTYTVRAVRPHLCEVDFDIALHGQTGPASRWAARTRPGDRVAICGPNAAYPRGHGGLEFQPPSPLPRLLLVGDETAVPAIASILAGLPREAQGQALLEVRSAEDALPVDAPPGVIVTWLARGDRPVGAKLVPAVAVATADFGRRAPGGLAGTAAPALAADLGPDSEDVWEVPERAVAPDDVYAWLAGESAVIRLLRRHLVNECRLDRRAVAFMGYWRLGHAEID